MDLLPIFAGLTVGTVGWSTVIEEMTKRYFLEWFNLQSVTKKRAIFAGGLLALNIYAFMIQPDAYTIEAGIMTLFGTVAAFVGGHKWHKEFNR